MASSIKQLYYTLGSSLNFYRSGSDFNFYYYKYIALKDRSSYIVTVCIIRSFVCRTTQMAVLIFVFVFYIIAIEIKI